jgi:hypothetical protein
MCHRCLFFESGSKAQQNNSLASTIFQNFVASDNSSELFASLKRIHGLMPYFMMKAALKISNPMGMIRSMLLLLSFPAVFFGTTTQTKKIDMIDSNARLVLGTAFRRTKSPATVISKSIQIKRASH